MTPFDPVALLAILLAFYLPASPANLARAFTERPEYFAGGELIGHSGDALRLPDGTVWDLIFDVGNEADTHYQTIIPGGGSDDQADPLFVLTAGPFTPLHADALRIVAAGEVFAPIVADAIASLHTLDDALALHLADLVDARDATDGIAAAGTDLDDAHALLHEELDGLAAAVPDDVLYNTAAHGDTIALHEAPYDDPAPGYVSVEPGDVPPELPEHQPGSGGSGDDGASNLGQTPEAKPAAVVGSSSGSSSDTGSSGDTGSSSDDNAERPAE